MSSLPFIFKLIPTSVSRRPFEIVRVYLLRNVCMSQCIDLYCGDFFALGLIECVAFLIFFHIGISVISGSAFRFNLPFQNSF